jgi:hypothetical protein
MEHVFVFAHALLSIAVADVTVHLLVTMWQQDFSIVVPHPT